MTIPMRQANSEDAEALTALVQAAYEPWIKVIGQKPGPMLADYAQLIADHWVGIRSDAAGLIEAMVLIEQADAMLLDNIAVRPDMQGQGRGKALVAWAEIIAKDAGFSCLRLYAHEKMAANVALYERLGFTITKRVTEKGLNRIYMEKWLGRRDL
ncbi:GNAT family N-acetyltransferase [Gymnodinialimonas hymeniacidonis]|uniref:GNAT family N-acetyltransferase n=1 Tax=Gymnodinialimonas hymeniacidonis TaxID=3126508 RepID=UPI0034C62BF0